MYISLYLCNFWLLLRLSCTDSIYAANQFIVFLLQPFVVRFTIFLQSTSS